jgi:hypothetical protein
VSHSRRLAKSTPKGKSLRERLGVVPWAVLLQVAMVIGNRWRALSVKDRQRLSTLVRASRGRPDRLSAKERAELRRLAAKLDVKRMIRELVLLRRARRRGRRRRRRRLAA